MPAKNYVFPICLALLLIMVSAFAESRGKGPGYSNQGPVIEPTASVSPSASAEPSASPAPAASTSRQVFVVRFRPSNLDPVYGAVRGYGRFVVDGDVLGAYLQLTGLAPGVMHEQDITSGTTCPDFTADSNGDGTVDIVESEAVTGPPLVPLSLDPNFLANSIDSALYPVPSTDGRLTFIASASIAALSAGGTTPTPTSTPTSTPSISPSVSLSPLPSDTPILSPSPTSTPAGVSDLLSNLDGHAVEIHGVSASTNLPATVQTGTSTLPATGSLPVACGTLFRVRE